MVSTHTEITVCNDFCCERQEDCPSAVLQRHQRESCLNTGASFLTKAHCPSQVVEGVEDVKKVLLEARERLIAIERSLDGRHEDIPQLPGSEDGGKTPTSMLSLLY